MLLSRIGCNDSAAALLYTKVTSISGPANRQRMSGRELTCPAASKNVFMHACLDQIDACPMSSNACLCDRETMPSKVPS